MEKDDNEELPDDFIRCVQKLLSSISTLNKHLSLLNRKETIETEDITTKLQAIKDAITSLAPAVETARQLGPNSSLVQQLTNHYSKLCNDYKEYFAEVMAETRPFTEYKEHIERLSTWLASTNANIREVLQSVNKQRALLVIKNLDELSKYKSLLERATALNRNMVADLPTEQATTMRNEMDDVKEQWRILIEGLNTLKERHASRYTSPEPTSQEEERLARQNENLLHYIEGWITVARQLIQQEGEMIPANDDENLHDQIEECEREILRLKTLLDEDRRRHAGEVTRSLVNELEEVAQSLANARLHVETRLVQEQALEREVDSLTEWLTQFIEEHSSTTDDHQTIALALKERQGHYDELIHCQDSHPQRLKEKIDRLTERWNELSSLSTKSSTSGTTATAPISSIDLSTIESERKSLERRAEELLTKVVQLGNRHDIEQLNENIRTFLSHNDTQISSNLKVYLPDQVYEQLLIRQRVLEQMLIDTKQIDRLRVNFVAHFNTDNDVIAASNEISSIIDRYPREMTSELRLWFNEQQTSRVTAPLATVDSSKSIDDFQDYVKELEQTLEQIEENENNETKVKKLLEHLADRPSVPSSLSAEDRQRLEHLEKRFGRVQARIEALEKTRLTSTDELEQFINHVDQLIQRLKDFEEKLRANVIQPLSDYERLIPDCQCLISELEQNLRLPVEQTITHGKRFYSTDNRDSSGIESADESGPGGVGPSRSSPSPLAKKYPDLSARKVRRHVLQLTQRWKSANTNLRHRLKVLQRVQKTVDDLRAQLDQIYAHLAEIDLAFAQRNYRRSLTIDQIPTEIEQNKHLFNNLMSCKASIDDLRQSAQMIEGEYEIPMTNRVQELEQKWEHSLAAVTQRMQFLQDSVKSSDHDIYASSVEYPWQRVVAFNKVPYYINHTDQSTSWDHPKMLELIRSLSNFNDIRFSAYRTAMKLRTLQKRLCLDLTSLSDIISVFEEPSTIDSPTRNLEKYIDVNEILNYLQMIFDKTAKEYPQMINVILTVDLTLNWLLNIYDVNRTGSIRLIAMKMALALLCRGNIEEKYRYIFSLTAYRASSDQDQREVVDRSRLSLLFQQAIVIPKQLGEVAAFGGSNVEPSVKSCFDYAQNPDVITAEDFLEWVKLEPQSLVWLPVMHRLAASEAAKHEARCSICKIYPILGFRYRSLKHFNCDICQTCFFSGKQTKHFKMDDPLQEYYTETTSSEDLRDFFRIFKNKLCSKHRKHPKLGYLPLPHVFDNNLPSATPSPAPSPILLPSISTPFKPEVFTAQVPPSSSSPIESTDEHGIIAQHCRNLNTLSHASPRAAAHEILTRSRSLDQEQRSELEAIIRDLEEENRLLQMEYERLCQQHMEKSLRINEQLHRSDSQLGSLGYLNDYNSSDREMLREAKQLRHHKTKLEQRMKILEEHNKQLERQLKRSKQLLFRESPALHHYHHHHQSQSNVTEPRIPASPLHGSTSGLRRSVERSLERQPNLITIDNLFHMADDINRAVGDLVSVITEPQTNGSSSSSYHPIAESSLVA